MKHRLISILEHLKSKSAEGLTGSIKDFRAMSDYSFELQTELPGKVFLKWEAGGDDEILRRNHARICSLRSQSHGRFNAVSS